MHTPLDILKTKVIILHHNKQVTMSTIAITPFRLDPEDIKRAKDKNIPDLYTEEIDLDSQRFRNEASRLESIWRNKKVELSKLENYYQRLPIFIENLRAIQEVLGLNTAEKIKTLEEKIHSTEAKIKELANDIERTKPSGY